jgi:predicted GNAT family N-acyltransferase
MSEQKQKSPKPHYHFNLKAIYNQTDQNNDGKVNSNIPPKCKVCGHHHIDKCPICGHVLHVKSNIYSASSCPSGGRPNHCNTLHFGLYSPSNAETFNDGWSLAKIIRRKVFVEEKFNESFPSVTCEELWDQEVIDDDTTCQHSVAFKGDMSIGTARWRIISQNNTHRLIKLDRICVLNNYRRSKVCTQLIAHAISVGRREAATLNTVGVLIYIPTNMEFLTHMLSSLNFQAFPQQQITEGGQLKVPFVLYF